MKEWGGYLPFELPRGKEYFSNIDEDSIVRLDCGRSAFWYALRDCLPKKLYVPYLNCMNSTDPAQMLGIPWEYYRLSEDLLPIGIDPKDDEAVLWVNYYGNANADKVRKVADRFRNTNLLIDNCHAFFSTVIEDAYNCYSARKFFGVCDGAYLIKKKIKKMALPRSSSSESCMFLLQTIEKGTNACYQDNLKNEDRLGKTPKSMSVLTKRILESVDYKAIQRIRNDNFEKLHSLLGHINAFQVDCSSNTHMYYPLLAEKIKLRERLIERKIYTPTWWRHVPGYFDPEENILEARLSKYMLMLPIDQRYTIEDMAALAKIVTEEYRKSDQ